MRAVLPGYNLGHRGRSPEGFWHHGQKSPLVDHRIGALCRIHYLPDFWYQEGEKDGVDFLTNGKPGNQILDSRLRGNDRQQFSIVIPAKAGIQGIFLDLEMK